jgi:hypothetical protein
MSQKPRRAKAMPEPEPEPNVEIAIPNWPDAEPPPAMRVYNYAVKAMMWLAASCPDPNIQLAAMQALREEFSPSKAAASVTTEVEVIAKLRRALSAEAPLEELELETETSGAALPAGKSGPWTGGDR